MSGRKQPRRVTRNVTELAPRNLVGRGNVRKSSAFNLSVSGIEGPDCLGPMGDPGDILLDETNERGKGPGKVRKVALFSIFLNFDILFHGNLR